MSSLAKAPGAAPALPWLAGARPVPVLLALLVFAQMLWNPAAQDDGDTLWHVRTGRWILEHGQIPHVDIFSHTMPGAPWTAQEWLSQVLMSLGWRLAEIDGVVAFCALAAAAAMLMVMLRASRDLDAVGQLAIGIVVAALLSRSLLARPHVIALPLLAAWTWMLLDNAENRGGRQPPWPWLVLVWLWANLHSSYIFGVLLAGAFGLEALINARTQQRAHTALRWALFGLGCAIAALATPNGVQGVLYPFQVMSMTTLNEIVEWHPVDFSQFDIVEAALLATLYMTLNYPVRLSPVRTLILLGVLHMTLQHIRNEVLLALVGAMILAPAIGAARKADQKVATPLNGALTAAGLAILLAIRLAMPAGIIESAVKPVAALAAVPADLRAKPVLNDYGMGGYLILNDIKPYIDGRSDMYGDEFVRDYKALDRMAQADFEKVLAQRNIAWAILQPASPLIDKLAKAGWRTLYTDGFAQVQARGSD